MLEAIKTQNTYHFNKIYAGSSPLSYGDGALSIVYTSRYLLRSYQSHTMLPALKLLVVPTAAAACSPWSALDTESIRKASCRAEPASYRVDAYRIAASCRAEVASLSALPSLERRPLADDTPVAE